MVSVSSYFSTATGPAGLQPLVAGEVLPSVSARLPGRALASSGGQPVTRAFCVDSRLGFAAMTALAEQRGVVWQSGFTSEEIAHGDSATIDGIRALTHQIETLVTREIALAEALLGETAWLRKNQRREVLRRALDGLPENSPWRGRLKAILDQADDGVGVHLAVFVEPYLSAVLDGRKTMESRFGLTRQPPYDCVGRWRYHPSQTLGWTGRRPRRSRRDEILHPVTGCPRAPPQALRGTALRL